MFVTSFWMRPTLVSMMQEEDFKRFNFDLWCAALQAVQFRKWGFPLTMVTDFGGSLYFKQFPYSKLEVVDYPDNYTFFINDMPKIYALQHHFYSGNTYIDYHMCISDWVQLDKLQKDDSQCLIYDQEDVSFKKKTLFNNLKKKHILDFKYSDTYYNTDIYKCRQSDLTKQYVNRAISINNNIYSNLKKLCTDLYNVDLSALCINNGLDQIYKDVEVKFAKDLIFCYKLSFYNYEEDLQFIKDSIRTCDPSFYETMLEFEKHILTPITELPEDFT